MSIAKIFEHARKTPDRVAILSGSETISYGAFARRIAAARRFLEGAKIPAQMPSVLCISHSVDGWAARLALAAMGRTTSSVRLLSDLRNFGGEKLGCVVVREGEPRPGLKQLEATPNFKSVTLPADLLSGEKSGGKVADVDIASPPGGHILFASAVQGPARKFLLDIKNEKTHVDQRLQALGIDGRSVVNLFDWALSTAVGYTLPLGVWGLGGTIVFADESSRLSSLQIATLTHAIATPTIMRTVLTSATKDFKRNDALRLFVGGGPLPQRMAGSILAGITNQLFSLTGSTEAGVWCVTPIAKAADVGAFTVLPSAKVEVVDAKDAPVAAGTAGRVRVRALLASDAYQGETPQGARRFFRDGWFYSGDVGVFGQDGKLRLRSTQGGGESVTVNGRQHQVAPFERELRKRFGRDGVCIFGARVKGEENDRVHVVVEGKPVKQEELQKIAKAVMPGAPAARFHFTQKIPRAQNGAIRRDVVRREVLAAQRKRRAAAAEAQKG
jgi:acyl-CoA synthetase (AMP-forming)/AMP-acid ligase II